MAAYSVSTTEKNDIFLANTIGKLLRKLEPMIKTTAHLTEDELMQEINEKMHKESDPLSFESEIGEKLGNELKQNVISEIEEMLNQNRHMSDKTYELVTEQVAERIASSGSYMLMENQFEEEIDKISQKLQKNFRVELKSLEISSKKINHKQRQSVISLSDVDSLNDSFTFSNFQFLKWDQFEEMVEKCGAENEIEEKIHSLTQLTKKLNPQFLDQSSAEKLLPILKDALLSDDINFAKIGLQFYSKMLSSSHHFAVKTILIHLLDVAKDEFSPNSHLVPHLNQGISLNQQTLLLVFRLIHRCQMNIVENWIRLPQNDIRAISSKTFNLIEITKPKNFLTPLHIFSLLDPDANFLRRWLKTSHGQRIWLDSFNWSKLMDFLARKLLSYLRTEINFDKFSSTSNTTQVFHYDKNMLEYLHAYITLNIFSIFFQHRESMIYKLEEKSLSSIDLLIILITKLFILCTCHVSNIKKYCLGHCIARICQQLLSVESNSLMLKEDVILNIASPVLQCLDEYSQSRPITVPENSLIISCNLLTHYAKNINSAPFFLHSNICKIIQKFTQKLLENVLFNVDKKQVYSAELKLQFIRLCSFVYIHHTSVDQFLSSQIPNILYATWKTSGKNLFITTTLEENDQSQAAVLPEFYLRFLAYFLATPNGLRKLQEMGAVEECVYCLVHNSPSSFAPFEFETITYLLLRASTVKEGILSLDESEFFSPVISNLWKLCEHEIDDSSILSLDNIERKIQLQVDQLLSYLSSFSAISTLSIPKIPDNTSSSSWPPKSLRDLLNCVLSSEKLNSSDIFNWETFELMKLQVLSGIVSSLDSSLLLQSHYNYQQHILSAQINGKSDESGQVIINEMSVARHNLLVKTMCIGGPSEKISPVSLPQIGTHLIYPILDDSVSSDYYIPRFDDDNEDSSNPLASFLAKLKENKIPYKIWLHLCTQAFKDTLMTCKHSEKLLFQTIEKCLQLTQSNMPNTPQLLPILTNLEISPVYKRGIDLTMKYGCYLGLMNESAERDLTEFLAICQDTFVETTSVAKASAFPWFAATIFLMSCANKQSSMKILARIQNSQRPDLMWLSTPDNCGTGIEVVQNSNDVVWTWLSHSVEEIIAYELPYVHSAFKMASASIPNICYLWLRQCFWNYFDWPEICNFVVLCVLHGPSHIIFYLVAVLSHLQDDILIRAQRIELNGYLLEEPLHGFKLKTYLPYLNYLSEKYSLPLKTSMQNMVTVNR